MRSTKPQQPASHLEQLGATAGEEGNRETRSLRTLIAHKSMRSAMQPQPASHLEQLGAAAGEKEDGEARLLQAEQRGAVGVKGAEDDLAASALLQHHLQGGSQQRAR